MAEEGGRWKRVEAGRGGGVEAAEEAADVDNNAGQMPYFEQKKYLNARLFFHF